MTDNSKKSTVRFSDRVQNYTRYRPSYPQAAISWLVEQYALGPQSCIADVGSGTGIFSDLLMTAGLPVFAVEPNERMRLESDRLHSRNPLYTSFPGTAEATLLESESVDMIVAAQSFHWFNTVEARREFQRILRPHGILVLVWNRRDNTSDFQLEYESVLGTLPEYGKVKHTRLNDTDIEKFFGNNIQKKNFAYSQSFDASGFAGRVFSSSYTPSPDDEGYSVFRQKIDDLFRRYSSKGVLSFSYSTELYAGNMS